MASQDPTDLEAQVGVAQAALDAILDQKHKHMRGATKKAICTACLALDQASSCHITAMEAVRHTHGDEAEASPTDEAIHILGKWSTPSPSPLATGTGSAKHARGAPVPGLSMAGDQGVMDRGAGRSVSPHMSEGTSSQCSPSSSNEQEGDSTRGRSKRGPGPPHAIIVKIGF
ncbi:hypothetical protein JB92DRAFT_3125021 [Gautieria morchelliformis]|nr:hypothetical protein JB92DRAFT_3125021 [Gautieria morchelliformis]